VIELTLQTLRPGLLGHFQGVFYQIGDDMLVN
jgi:hypothetical protein